MRMGLTGLCILFVLTSCGNMQYREPARETFLAMDTFMTFTVYGENVEEALAEAKEQVLGLEKLWSVTDTESEIYAVNHSEGRPVEVSRATEELVAFALKMAAETDGALEPTIYPVLTAWGFTTGEYRIPSEEALAALLGRTGYEKAVLTEGGICLPEGMMLDLGAVGKGYAGDLLAELLAEEGVTSALLDIGGNIQAIGRKPDGSEWKVGLRAPYSDAVFGSLMVSDAAVVTSGAYERYFTGEDGKQYGHIIDPDTGYPVENGLLSVTVAAREGKLCDALSTALYVMGAEKAVNFWRERQDFDMILVMEDERVLLTEGIEERFSLDKAYQDWTKEVIRAGFGD